MKLLLSTYPRSGQHFLRNNIKQRIEVPHLPIKFEWTHDLLFNDYDIIITSVRDPKECMASYIAMTLHYEDISPLREKQPIRFYVDAAKMEYMLFSKYALEKVNYIYKYEDVVDNIDNVLYNLINKLELDDNNYKLKTGSNSFSDDFLNNMGWMCPSFPCEGGTHKQFNKTINIDLKDKPEERHLVTAKTSKYYDEVLEILDSENLDQIYNEYNKMLEKSVSISDKAKLYPNISKLFVDGHVPYSFENLSEYKTEDSFTKIFGTGQDTIKYFENFVSEEDNAEFMSIVTKWPELKGRDHCYPLHLAENFNWPSEYNQYNEKMSKKMIDFATEKWQTSFTKDRPSMLMVHPSGTYLKPHTDILSIDYVNNDPDKDEGPTQEEQLKKYPNLWDGYLAILCYMNDDFEGGYLYFPDFDYYLKPKRNSIIMFPGGLHCVHGVTEITKGTRYTISQWVKFDIY